jgi:hypothetical protein
VEIQYLGGVTEEDMATAYSTITRKDLADAVVHKGRFAIAITCPSPSLVRTAARALKPAPLDRIKVLDVTLPKGERAKAEVLANRYQRENLARHFEIDPRAIKDVLNQFFEGGGRRQITYVECATIDDATIAAGPLRSLSEGKSRILTEGRFLVEIVGEEGWTDAMERLIKPRLLEVTADEQKAIEAARKDAPEGDETSG